MSKHDHPTALAVLDRALGDQKRTARLQTLIITVTCCFVAVVALLAAIITLLGGHFLLSVGLGAIPVVLGTLKVWKHIRRNTPALGKS
ncbi:hypothetical protein DM794_06855 [Paenarthrobacter ureafaciens]|uniref:hypothetical protein n=1 Tax=Paenarthrobacter ureafaciens TaxID=37931 RepID=UPI0015BC898D|nr:hypothetical protein [Paenarthrobacter ureafaciens]NWL26783.1 hypothetical protein [Paenarthrobacter ureafaciens]